MRTIVFIVAIAAALSVYFWLDVGKPKTPEQVLEDQIKAAENDEFPTWDKVNEAAGKFAKEHQRLREVIERRAKEEASIAPKNDAQEQ